MVEGIFHRRLNEIGGRAYAFRQRFARHQAARYYRRRDVARARIMPAVHPVFGKKPAFLRHGEVIDVSQAFVARHACYDRPAAFADGGALFGKGVMRVVKVFFRKPADKLTVTDARGRRVEYAQSYYPAGSSKFLVEIDQ